MQECDKRNSHISSKFRIYISSNYDRHPLLRPSLHFTQYTSLHLTLHFPFKLPLTTLCHLIWLNQI